MKRTIEGTIGSERMRSGLVGALEIRSEDLFRIPAGTKVRIEWDELVPPHECEGMLELGQRIEFSELSGVWRFIDGCEFITYAKYCPYCGKKMEV